ncbi:hypothetical protein MT342_05555 [Staphylococcus sp. NRL 21/187]|nr:MULTISPECIES: hypothetical protein [unclassified Staphylococcus]MCJ1656127.1 hypothetical protein [Staphylococcus sp. NRL 21/187]MCJ1667945.1 hypothetical protein [Staphylococcus sp. NRL 19/737]
MKRLGGNEYSEISNLTIQDIREARNHPKTNDMYELELKNINNDKTEEIRKLDISKRLLNALEKAYSQEVYYSKNGKGAQRFSTREFLDGKYIFRNVVTTKYEDPQIDKQYIYRRMALLKTVTEGEILSVLTITNSGMIYFLSQMADQNKQVSIYDMEYIVDRYQISVHSISASYTYKTLAKKHKEALALNYNVTFNNL